VFFGFTHCKVVCPRNLAKLSAVLDGLGATARDIVPLYITVDPERDSPERMKHFLEERYPRFTGLTGTREQVEAARRAFRVFARRQPADATGDYDVPHTAIAYLLDRSGCFRDHFPEIRSNAEIVERIAGLLATDRG
jgi:protein SCO1/2